MKMEFPNQIIQLENSKEIFTSRMSHAEDQISGLKDKVEALDQISNGKKNRRNKHTGNVGHH